MSHTPHVPVSTVGTAAKVPATYRRTARRNCTRYLEHKIDKARVASSQPTRARTKNGGFERMDPERVHSYLQVACAGLGFDIGEVWWTSNQSGASAVAAIGKYPLFMVRHNLPTIGTEEEPLDRHTICYWILVFAVTCV